MTKDKSTQETIQSEKPVAVKPTPTVAENIWSEIKNMHIDMFGLPNQIVSQYCSPATIEPSKCYVVYKVGAILPALEVALSKKYSVELCDKYITITPKR